MASQTGRVIAIGALAGVAALLASKAGYKSNSNTNKAEGVDGGGGGSSETPSAPPEAKEEASIPRAQFGAKKKAAPLDDSLSISKDCSSVFEGKDWIDRCALPAIDHWIREGYGRAPWYGWSEITRGILVPYNQNLVKLVPWADLVYQYAPSPPDLFQIKSAAEKKMLSSAFQIAKQAFDQSYQDRLQQFNRMYPQLSEFIGKLDDVVYQRMSGLI